KHNESQASRIAGNFVQPVYLEKAQSDELEKGKKANIGEVREWNGEKWKKQVDGWVRMSDGKKSAKMEEHEVDKEDAKDVAQNKKGGAEKNKGLGLFSDEHLYSAARMSHTTESLTSSVKEILNGSQGKPEKVADLFKQGLHVHEIVNVSGTPLSATIDYLNKAKREGKFDDAKQAQKQESGETSENKSEVDFDDVELPEVSVEDRWNSYQHYGMMIGLKRQRAMFAYGSGGVGKTYELLDPDNGVFSRLKLRKGELNPVLDAVGEDGQPLDTQGGDSEDSIVGFNPQTGERFLKKDKYDYITVTGKLSATRMFELMQEHNGKVLVFDDCDSVLTQGDDGVNVLKGALDTSGDGTISWEGKGSLKSGYAGIKGATAVVDKNGKPSGVYNLPKTFRFTGQVVFISNLPDNKVPQPLRSRSLMIDLTMNRQETISKVKRIAPRVKFKDPEGNIIQVSNENRQKAVDFMDRYLNKISEDDLNMRTYQKIAMTYQTIEEFGSHLDPDKVVAASIFSRKK
ncbi:MAG TPA: hypothetical protein PKI46_04275, partial [Bacteroidales bacterium]|nr:hypothetical protein [Bacteroidales bacterium]